MTDREKKLNTDREWLADELMRAGSLALPSSLSAAALFERMDAADQQAANIENDLEELTPDDSDADIPTDNFASAYSDSLSLTVSMMSDLLIQI